ncbi:MAG: hypothetical protein ACP5FK_10545 [bacterium]
MIGLFHEQGYQLDENVQAHFICADTPLDKIYDFFPAYQQHETITQIRKYKGVLFDRTAIYPLMYTNP